MAGTVYLGDSGGTAKKIASVYVGVDGFAKQAGRIYIGDGEGIARKVYEPDAVNEVSVSIPVMTSNTKPSGTASASSEYNANTPAWKAFDDDTATQWTSASETKSTGGTAWLQYDFGYAVRPTLMTYKVTGSYRAKAYSLLGSNDGSGFTELSAGTLPNSVNVFTVTLNTLQRYRVFRLVLTGKYVAAARFFVAVFGIDGYKVADELN